MTGPVPSTKGTTMTTDLRRPMTVALVGLGFGAEFAPIYRDHPDVAQIAICDADVEVLDRVGNRFGIAERYHSLDEVLRQDHIDAVHLVTRLTEHGKEAISVLNAGKHCASTVPMAVDLDELSEIVSLQRPGELNYMMMETAVYTREFLHCQEIFDSGAFGSVTFANGVHYQDMEGWPAYWNGLPPMWYMTHAISPVLKLLGTRASTVRCLGSGRLPDDRALQYGNPYPAETAIFELAGSTASVEVSRTLFQAARSYTEAFSIYGERYGFEWPQLEDEAPLHFTLEPTTDSRGRHIRAERITAPDRADRLPPEIAAHTTRSVHSDGTHASFVQGGGHGGSHPHLVHEFVRSIVERRKPVVDAVTAANWTAAGIVAHLSAMKGGEPVDIPAFG